MGSVFGYLFIAAIIIFVSVVAAVLFSVVIRFIGIFTFIVFREPVIKSGKDIRELAVETWRAIKEVWQKKGLKNLSTDSSVLLIVWGAVIAALVTYSSMYFGIENIGGAISAMAAASVAYFVLFIYIFFIDIKRGREKGIELAAFISVASMVIFTIAFIWSYFIKVATLDPISATATVIAAGIALFALTIAFLGHKRKSGVALECSLINISGTPSLVFMNLKDRPVAIYDVSIELGNLEVRGILDKWINLDSYDVQEVDLTTKSTLAGIQDGLELALKADFSVFSFFIKKAVKIRAMTNLGEHPVAYKDVKLLTDNKTQLALSVLRTEKELDQFGITKNKEMSEGDTCLALDLDNDRWEIVAEDDPRIVPEAEFFGGIKFLKKLE